MVSDAGDVRGEILLRLQEAGFAEKVGVMRYENAAELRFRGVFMVGILR